MKTFLGRSFRFCCGRSGEEEEENFSPQEAHVSQYEIMGRRMYGVPPGRLSALRTNSSDSILIAATQTDSIHHINIDEPFESHLDFVETGILQLDEQVAHDETLFCNMFSFIQDLQLKIDHLLLCIQSFSLSRKESLGFEESIEELDALLSEKYLNEEAVEAIVKRARELFIKCNLVLEHSQAMRAQARTCTVNWEQNLKNVSMFRSEKKFLAISRKDNYLKQCLTQNMKKARETESLLDSAITRCLAISDIFLQYLSKKSYRQLFGCLIDQSPLMGSSGQKLRSLSCDESDSSLDQNARGYNLPDSISFSASQTTSHLASSRFKHVSTSK